MEPLGYESIHEDEQLSHHILRKNKNKSSFSIYILRASWYELFVWNCYIFSINLNVKSVILNQHVDQSTSIKFQLKDV